MGWRMTWSRKRSDSGDPLLLVQVKALQAALGKGDLAEVERLLDEMETWIGMQLQGEPVSKAPF